MNEIKSWEEYIALASNPNTSKETLDELSNNEDWVIRRNVASNPNTTTETLDKLSEDKYWGVRHSVASNPNTLPETLDKLSEDKDCLVRGNVAMNPNTSSETLDKLISDENHDIRNAVANNPNFYKQFLILDLQFIKSVLYYITDKEKRFLLKIKTERKFKMGKLNFLNVIVALSLVSFATLFWTRIGSNINSWSFVLNPIFFPIIVVLGVFIFVLIFLEILSLF